MIDVFEMRGDLMIVAHGGTELGLVAHAVEYHTKTLPIARKDIKLIEKVITSCTNGIGETAQSDEHAERIWVGDEARVVGRSIVWLRGPGLTTVAEDAQKSYLPVLDEAYDQLKALIN